MFEAQKRNSGIWSLTMLGGAALLLCLAAQTSCACYRAGHMRCADSRWAEPRFTEEAAPNPAVDTETAARLKGAFARRELLRYSELNISVRNGIAYLFGIVPSDVIAEQAGDVAARVPGVTDVVNHINVDNTGPLQSDEQIERNGVFNMIWSEFGDTSGAQMRLDNGVATLTGEVESWRGSQAAEDAALAAGAVGVVNHLTIEHPALPYSTPRSKSPILIQGR